MASFTLLLGFTVYYGVTVVLPPANPPLTANLANRINKAVTADGCVLPPSIIVDMYHDKSSLSEPERLKYVCFACGPLPPEVGDRIAQITHLSSLFGSTEIGSPIQEVCDPEDWEYANYSPFYGSHFRPLHEDDLFEHVFVRQRELDLFQSIFSTYPNLDHFETKGIYRKHPVKSNTWKFCHRLDDVIVLSNAEKFNPVNYENAVSAHPTLRSAIVGGHGRSQTCLFVEPLALGESDAGNTEILDTIWPTILEANRTSPAHARVMKDVIIFTDQQRGVEHAGKETVQREATLPLYQDDIDQLYQAPALPNISPKMLVGLKNEESKPLREALLDIVTSCIDLNLSQDPSAELFNLGIDSLQIIAIGKKINAYSMQFNLGSTLVTLQTIYSNLSIKMLESVLQHEEDRKGHESLGTEMQDVFKQWSRGLPQATNVPHPAMKPNLVALLTGSTGSLGSYILDFLISNSNISKVYCLTHGDDGQARQTASFMDKGLKPLFSKVIFCPYNFTNPPLGLDAYQSLQEEVTHIIHNAWDVNLYRSLSAFITPHISGVRYLIDFCGGSSCNPQLMFISTQGTSLGLPMMADRPNPESSLSWWKST
ncbi:MAG: hypothetical protein Q9192_006773 [Flavoplaca navasiana]